MAIRKNKRRALLLLLGWGGLFFGLGKGYIDQEYNYVLIGLACVGALCLVVYLKNLQQQCSQAKRIRNPKKVLFFVLLIFFNMLAYIGINYAAYKNNIRFDVTQFKQHTLSENTLKLITSLKENLKISILYVGFPPKYLEDLLKEYERLSEGKISTEIIDPIIQIGYAAQFGQIIQGKERKAVVQSGNERADVDFSQTPLTEDLLNNAIKSVTRKARAVYFLTGHNEYPLFNNEDNGLSKFTKYLMTNNVIAKELVLTNNENIPTDCSVLIIPGPKENLSELEENIIRDYLKGGGDALFLIENVVVTTPDKPLTEDEIDKNPSLNSLLNEWGVNVNQDIVVDLASHASGDVGSPATRNYMAHQDIIKNIDYTFYIRPRSISLEKDRRESIKAVPFILTQSKEQSWGETNRTLEVKFDAGVDRPGPVPIGFVIFEPLAEDLLKDIKSNKGTRIIVVSDADFLTNAYVDYYNNAEMGLRIINWLAQLDYEVFVEKDFTKVEEFNLTSQQKRMVIALLYIFPVMIVFLGFIAKAKQYF
ncbi:MAG: GldG family protein [Candidatus Omnitrophica bacterium]|nr:GldG family protein [Candidatus Omnitrophota bacterium]MCB9747430.1 GldG family protein [Candidatus Omnitrophota bacterium]